MLEDMLGWIVVLIGAIVMRFTDMTILDPIMSIAVALFISFNAVKNLREALDLFLEKTPKGISIQEIKTILSEIDGVLDVHHIHIRSLDDHNNDATMHIIADKDVPLVKKYIREKLKKYKITHVTLELETKDEICPKKNCHIEYQDGNIHCYHH